MKDLTWLPSNNRYDQNMIQNDRTHSSYRAEFVENSLPNDLKNRYYFTSIQLRLKNIN